MASPAEWGPEFLLNTESNVSQLAAQAAVLPDGRFVAVWTDNSQFFEDGGYLSLRLQVFNTDGSKSGEEILIKESSSIRSRPQIDVLSDGRLVVTHVEQDLVGASLRVQVFEQDGSTSIPETIVNVSDDSPQNVIVGALQNGNAVLTWYDPFSRTISAQIIEPDGTKVGAEFSVNPVNKGSGQQITVLNDGRFVISWTDDSRSGEDQSGQAVRAQIFDQDGGKIGGPFLLNTLTDTSQSAATTAALANGGFVATWRDDAYNSGDSSAIGISAQIFDSDGNKVGGQFLVNSTTEDVQERPEVAALPDGGFVIAWYDYSTMTSEHPFISIKAQVFSADGQKAGAEFEVTNIAFYVHGSLSIAVLPDGRFVVTWDDDGQTKEDPSFLGAYAQIFDPRSEAVDVVGTNEGEQLAGTVFDDTIRGGEGNDELFGAAGSDQLFGDADDDILAGGPDGDVLDGGAGTDTASYANAAAAVTANLGQPALNTGDAAGDTYVSIENLTGSRFDDVLSGDAAGNIVSGLAGSDLLNGGPGDDTLDGGSGIDTASYRSGAAAGVNVDLSAVGPQNTGSAGQDTLISIENLWGTDFADSLTGDAGDNQIQGFLGADTMDGGDGFDTLSYAAASGGVAVDLQTGLGTLGAAAGDVVTNFEAVLGSDHDDALTGDSNDNVLTGGAGADALAGGGGSDTASYATAGSGVVADLLIPGLNSGDAAGDTYVSIENLEGSRFDDVLFGDAGANRIAGGLGDDFVEGGAGADELDGGAGFDILAYIGSSAAVTVDLELGTVSGGDATGDVIAGFEDIFGSQFDDTLAGHAGDNILEGGAGADHLDGKGGLDTVSYITSSAGVTVNLETGLATGGDAEGDTFDGIENIIGSEFGDVLTPGDFAATTHLVFGAGGDDTINAGVSGADELYGGSGNDVLTGNSNNNILDGGTGADTLDGGTGTDRVRYVDSDAGVIVDLTAGTGSGGHAQGDQLVGIENIDGSKFGDTLTGNGSTNFLIAGDGDDTLSGGDGGDRLEGGAGNDRLEGGEGADSLIGGEGIDLADYAASLGGVVVNLERGVGVRSSATGDVLEGIENVRGSAHDDTLIGDALGNVLEGGAGIDTLDSRGGDDTLDGGAGNDLLGGGAGNDNLSGQDGGDKMWGGEGDDTIEGGNGWDSAWGGAGNDIMSGGWGSDRLYGQDNADKMWGGAGDDTVEGGNGWDNAWGGAGNDVMSGGWGSDRLYGQDGDDGIWGGGGNDTIDGGAGSDTLFGGLGNDQLTGGSGTDMLYGQEGADTFVFADNAGSDTVFDWEDGLDALDFAGVTSVTTFADLTVNAVSGTQTDITYDDGTGTVTLTVLSASPFSIDQDDVII